MSPSETLVSFEDALAAYDPAPRMIHQGTAVTVLPEAVPVEKRRLAVILNPIKVDDVGAFEALVEASGGHGERVERAEDLPAALARAVAAVRGGQQALLNVICDY